MPREEQLQEALIGWVMAGGSVQGLFVQIEQFLDGLSEFDRGEQAGDRARALERLEESLDYIQWMAGKVDQAGGFPEVPRHVRETIAGAPAPSPESRPAPVLIEVLDGCVVEVRSAQPLQVSIWPRDEVREGLVPTRLLELPQQELTVLTEEGALSQQFPETKVIGGQTLHLLRVGGRIRYDRHGRPMYVAVPGKEAQS